MPRIARIARLGTLLAMVLLLVVTPELASAAPAAAHVAAAKGKSTKSAAPKGKKTSKASKGKSSKSAKAQSSKKSPKKSAKKASSTKSVKKSAKAKATKGKATKSVKSSKGKAVKGKTARSSKKGARVEKVTYKVKRGDSLIKIARKFNTDVKTLRKLNRMKPGGGLRAGKAIVVRVSKPGSGPRRLADGVSLPEEGPGYFAPRRERTFGTRGTVEHIQEAAAAVARAYPDTVPVFIGDVSFQHGGFMPPHKSHRGGRDVDVSYYLKDNQPTPHFIAVTASTMDAEKVWALFDAFLQSGHVNAIYVDRSLHKPLREAAAKQGYDEETIGRLFETRGYDKGASRKAVIRHIRGHRDHFHIRFDCPQGEHPSS